MISFRSMDAVIIEPIQTQAREQLDSDVRDQSSQSDFAERSRVGKSM
jgi:hypothetical protein